MISIKRYLLTVLIAAITLLIFLAALNGYKQSLNNSIELFDADLLSIATIISLTNPTDKVVNIDTNKFISFQIWNNDKLVSRTSNAPESPIANRVNGFSEKNFLGDRWRTYSQYQQDKQQWILVAEKKSRRIELAEKVILSSIYPIIISIPVAAILIWFILSKGLKPIFSINNQLILRKADNLNPIEIDDTPSELQMVINTINRLLNRLQLSFDREKRFAGDAAHELRTPLSVLKINMHNLEKEIKEEHEGLNKLKLGAERMTHVIDQILTLYRTTPEQFNSNRAILNLYKLCQHAISEYYPEIAKKNQTIELAGSSIFINGDSYALSSLLQNLISNASKYTPQGGKIIVCVKQNNNTIELIVEDSGTGIPEQLYEQVFRRFYRVGGDQHSSGAPGCGLGLSIVQHIVDLHHAQIKLSHSQFQSGLKTTISFNIDQSMPDAGENY